MSDNRNFPINRREFATRACAIVAATGIAAPAIAQQSSSATSDVEKEISRANAAIHQEIVFAAGIARVFQVLTVATEFDKAQQLSAAMNSDMKSKLGATPAMIDARPGGAFSLFGGYVTGYTLEIVASTHLVQAWRAGSWDAGLYSIARFELSEQGPGTKLVFDHTGFPSAAALHLAQGWHENYWEPIAKSLA
jgi:activator of HSP90 ATPase